MTSTSSHTPAWSGASQRRGSWPGAGPATPPPRARLVHAPRPRAPSARSVATRPGSSTRRYTAHDGWAQGRQLRADGEPGASLAGTLTPAELLSGLNPAQRLAVEHRGGPLLVVAGAGSGKTRVLTRRIAHLLATGDARPHEILSITFTNKAADEMRRRVVALVGADAERMWVSTFHSACLRMLRAHGGSIGYDRGFVVYDALDSRRLVEIVENELGIDTKRLPSRSVSAVISQAKSELVGVESFADDPSTGTDPYRRRIADVYVEYQRRLKAANAMDFDDLLFRAVELLEHDEAVAAGYRERFRHVLVDEYQDTNRAQHSLVALLTSGHRMVTVVGDSDQSIYRWRGADVTNILDFEAVFPDATAIYLEQNYRSTQTILDAANAVIAQNLGRRKKTLFTDGGAGPPICLYRAEDERDEASFVAGEARRLAERDGLSLGDVAVFYRTNAQSRVIEEELVRQGLGYQVIGGTRFYDRREVRDLLAYLRLVVNPDDEISFRRIVNVPKRGLGDTSVLRLAAHAARSGVPISRALFDAEAAGLSARALHGANELAAFLTEMREAASELPPGKLVELVATRSGYLDSLGAEPTHEAEGRIENIAELATVASEYERLSDFLETVALVSDTDDLATDASRVSLMTLHSAKGLEFPAVFMVGLEDGIFPHARTLGEPEELEEERRLCYVGLTRARRFLYLTHAWSRSLWGRTSPSIPSRFLSEIPEDLVREAGAGLRNRRQEWGPAPAAGFGTRSQVPAGPPATTGAETLGLAAGTRVVHDRWGEGTVVAASGEGPDAQATVRFASVGEKRLLLSAAPVRRATRAKDAAS